MKGWSKLRIATWDRLRYHVASLIFLINAGEQDRQIYPSCSVLLDLNVLARFCEIYCFISLNSCLQESRQVWYDDHFERLFIKL